ncbi:MAG TPA: MFS transporter [Anaerolineaceae bacterium]|nr:MFS transporter [Anaerolineaceae bacterium]
MSFNLKTTLKRLMAPLDLDAQRRKNYINVQVDGVGVGLANAASPFLPVFLARLQASSYEIGLLSSMPAITGLLLSIPLGQFLQTRRNVVPWYSVARVLVIAGYALSGLAAFFLRGEALIWGILAIWALVTIPQTVLAICFSVVMNAVAGPNGRFELMSRRWIILGFTTAVTVFLIGQLLDNPKLSFPGNYQLAFLVLSLGGVLSFIFSRQIIIPSVERSPDEKTNPLQNLSLVFSEKPFISFIVKRIIYSAGISMSLPLFPLYFVREIQATDSWIAAIATVQSAIIIGGYLFWTFQGNRRGSRTVMLWSTFGMAFYPILTALTHKPELIVVFAATAGFFQGGIDLVFFDELMRTVPEKYSATFVSFFQSAQYISSIVAPLLGTFLAETIGIGPALIISGVIRLLGFALFLFDRSGKKKLPVSPEAEGAVV